MLWAVVYNLVWAAAWFTFMRRQWLNAVVALGQPLPWTAEVWFIWVMLTIPLGIAVMAYCASGGISPWKAIVASMVVWLPFALGMVTWGIHESLSIRVLALDSVVNLVALVAAALIGAWSLPWKLTESLWTSSPTQKIEARWNEDVSGGPSTRRWRWRF